jgi:hypothetical protein
VPSSAQAELLAGLHEAFLSTPEIAETPERARNRYIIAIESLADYLEDIGAEAAWIERLDELSCALEDLTNGEIPELLRPSPARSAPGA